MMLSVATVSAQVDSTRMLQEVVIDAFETNRRLQEVPASIGILRKTELDRFTNASLLSAVNTLPGVRMEERSPGSYRFSIRGSSLRSPFGVRNVKVYWNGLPFTDGGGNTYLNLLDFSSVGSIEVIKGPGGSLYGAGTGGVLLLKSPQVNESNLQAGITFGSYGLQRYQAGGQIRGGEATANVQLVHHRSDGYREQTEFERTALNAEVTTRAGSRGSITAMLVYSDVYYQTPGGLTLQQYKDNPSQARSGPPGALGAVDARAAITNNTGYGGVVYDHDWSNLWTTTTGIYAAYTDFDNPSIRNYEAREETNFGLRTTTARKLVDKTGLNGKIAFGAEYQHFISPIRVYGNKEGKQDTLQVSDDLTSRAGLVFAQADLEFSKGFFVTLGGSVNFLGYDFLRNDPAPRVTHSKNFNAVFSPRLAVLKKFSDDVSVFASYSNGFSPPTLAEVRPSTNVFNRSLKAERGNNVELGVRGNVGERVGFDLVGYDFSMRNTLVVQRSVDGADWFINAGKTAQIGVEALVSYNFGAVDRSPLKVWLSYGHQHYRYKDYVVQDEDFSGNELTGIAPNMLSGGVDARFARYFEAHLTVNYVDEIPLNDRNTEYADSYTLVGLRFDCNLSAGGKSHIRIFGGADNLLDERYSLGNDLNAFGGRYYNAARPRNYYAGVLYTLGQR